MNRLPAFTIMELLMVSVLTVITVGAAFTAFQLINSQFVIYEQTSSRQLDLQQLHSLLLSDIYRANEVQMQGDRLHCVLPQYNLDYYTYEEQIIRTVQLDGIRADTFPVQLIESKAWLGTEERTFGIVDYLQLTVEVERAPVTLSFIKNYSVAEQL